jgi:hypothetical protein
VTYARAPPRASRTQGVKLLSKLSFHWRMYHR